MWYFPFKTPAPIRWIYPDLTWRGTSGDKIIYLTFDDGPVEGPTQFVLDKLDKYDAKATFFCVGENVVKNPYLLLDMVERGHKIANHTFNHLDGWKTPVDDYLQNIHKCQKEIDEIISRRGDKLFRPPYGKIKKAQIKKLKPEYITIMWDVLSGDFHIKLTPETCLEKSISHSRDGSIVIFHDSGKAFDKLKYILPKYLEHFSSRGYRFKRLSR